MSDFLIQKELKDIDIYRQTPIRFLGKFLHVLLCGFIKFLGYANEVGEAFRSIVPLSVVRLSYVISIGYVIADAFDKSKKASKVCQYFSDICDIFLYSFIILHLKIVEKK